MGYKLEITPEDWRTIEFVGGRYNWSTALLDYREEINKGSIRESIAWDIRDAFEMDEEGGHEMFPMLDDRSELWVKLFTLARSIV